MNRAALQSRQRRAHSIEPLEDRIAPAAAVFELSSLDGSNGFKISGVAANDYSGSSVSDAGDVNGDGFGDVIIGAGRSAPNGASYVVFGKAGGFAADLNLSTLNGTNGFKLSGVATFSNFGGSVSGAGDVNGDGFDDLTIGADRSAPNGASYVVFGKAGGFAADLNLSTLDGSNGFKLSGVAAGDYSGGSVSGAGDVNGDGFGDLIIGAAGADPGRLSSGTSYVVFGKAGGFAANLNLSMLNGSNGFMLNGVAAGDYSGRSVSAAGDVNGDGFGDLIIGANGADPNRTSAGASYVVFGKAGGFAANLNFATLDGSNGFKLSGVAPQDYSGYSVSAAGDVNGDGFGDLIIGADRADPSGLSSGTSYVVFGKAGGFAANLNLSMLNGSNGFMLSGVAAWDYSGRSVSAAGDVNGDGFGDLIIGADRADPSGLSSGTSYVVFGKAGGFAANLNLSMLNGSNGFMLSGVAAWDYSGRSVSAAGDVNGDGFGDLIIGGSGADPNGSGSGASYVVFGKAGGFAANLNLSTLDGSNGFRLHGVSGGDVSGFSVSTAGDVNGDGFGDLIIGAPGADPNGSESGASYVIFGSALGPLAAVSISDATLIEPTNGTAMASFTVTLSSPSAQTVAVSYSTADGTATAPGDYTAAGLTTLTFAPGETNKTLQVPLLANSPIEPDETFFINLSNPTNATILDGQAQGTILDETAPRTISVNDVTVREGDSGTVQAVFTVSLSRPSSQPVTVHYVTAEGTAVAFDDYTPVDDVLTFAPEEVSKTIVIDVRGDTLAEGSERFFLNLSNPTNGTIIDTQAQGFILDNDTGVNPGLLELVALDGSNGFRLSGVAAGDYSGGSVSDAGDVNGDGFGDLIIGAQGADPNGSNSGASYVVFGNAGGFAANLNLSTLDGSNGFKLSGVAADDRSGGSVSAAGDVNGDGFGDLIIGAFSANSLFGASYVVFGNAGGFAANLNLSTLDGSNGFKLSGVSFGDRSGGSVSAAGDVNGDGFGDLIIGTRYASPNGSNSGASYVVFGKAGGFAVNLNLSTLDGSNGFKLSGVAARDRSGGSVSAAGDVNGDGFGDVIVGANGADPNGSYSGASYVVFGKAGGFAADLNLSTLDGSNGFKLSGVEARDYSGYSVSAASDINGDGFDDLIIGAIRPSPNGSFSGTSYVVFGKAGGFAANLNLSTLDGSNGFKLSGVEARDYSGFSVSAAGDVNGDGFDDLIIGAIGAIGADPNGGDSGASYVVFGPAGGFAANLNLSTLDGSNGFKLSGVAAYDRSGHSVSAAGDVNGDGFGDLIIGAPGADPNGSGSGASYVIFGKGVEVSVSDAAVNEGDAGATSLEFTVSLSQPALVPVTVKLATVDGTALAGSDFAPLAPTTLTFAPGELSKTVSIEVSGDLTFEADETFSVMLSEANGAVIRKGTGIGTIQNDDAAPQVGIADASVVEGDAGASSLVFTVSLSAASAFPLSVNSAGADGTAVAGSDYTALTPGTLSFAPGETTKSITIDVLGDTSIEDHETFSVTLSGASGATIGAGTASGTILNDDTALRINDVSAREGDSGAASFLFTVSLEKPSAIPVTVSYASADGTANAGSDYQAAGVTQLTFAPGETTKTVAIGVNGDTEVEAHESFSVILSSATGAAIVNGTGTGTILNDETLVRISDASVLEGHGGERAVVFTVSLSAPTVLPVSVNFASADGTATGGSDYIPLTPGTLHFAPGETSKTIAVVVSGDIAVEPSETFSVLLSAATDAVIDDATGLGTILDDDVTIAGKRKATFTDTDGDLVTIKVSKGTLKVEDFTIVPNGLGAQLALVDFSGEAEFARADLSITAKRAPGAPSGDRLVDVGYVNASGIDLGKVVIDGDLGKIDAGEGIEGKSAFKKLTANSIGFSGAPGVGAESTIAGTIGVLKTKGDVKGVLNVTGGLADDGSGSAVQTIKKVVIGGNIDGSAGGDRAGLLRVSGDIGSVVVKGSVIGGAELSGIVVGGKAGKIKIGGDLMSGDADRPVTVSALGTVGASKQNQALALKLVDIGGNVLNAEILAGFRRDGTPMNADAGIGKISVDGNWTASSAAAGVEDVTGDGYGINDRLIGGGNGGILSRIASITIAGAVSGSEQEGDHFGVTAQQVGEFKLGRARQPLVAGNGDTLLLAADFTLVDFA